MGKTRQIPIRSLEQRGKSIFEINKIEPGIADANLPASDLKHRDDYFIFIYQERGENTITIDFRDIALSGNCLFCIQPGQVHFGHFAVDTVAWIISAAAEWVPAAFRTFLANAAVCRRPLGITPGQDISIFQKALALLYAFESQQGPLNKPAVQSMFDVCVHLFIHLLQQASDQHIESNRRPAMITQQFKSLLLSNFRVMKTPSAYAASLNITPAYLNEVVRQTTGYPVSHCIYQQIVLEAKRSLFYTDATVKEIAYALGYADPAYFIRLFKKFAGIAPLQFRQQYRS